MAGQPHPDSTREAALARLDAGEPAAAVAADLGVGLRTLRRWRAASGRPRARRSATLRVRALARDAAELDGASPERRAAFAFRLRAETARALDAGDLRSAVRLLSLRALLLPRRG